MFSLLRNERDETKFLGEVRRHGKRCQRGRNNVKSSLACVCTPMCSNCSRNDGIFLPGSLLCPGIKGCLSSSKWRLTRKGPNPVSRRCSNRLSRQGGSSNSLLKDGGGGGAHVDRSPFCPFNIRSGLWQTGDETVAQPVAPWPTSPLPPTLHFSTRPSHGALKMSPIVNRGRQEDFYRLPAKGTATSDLSCL